MILPVQQPRSRKAAQEEAGRLRLALAEIAHLERQGVFELTPEQKQQLEDHSRRRLAELEQAFNVDMTQHCTAYHNAGRLIGPGPRGSPTEQTPAPAGV
jgi:hypothetical protein